MDITDTLLTEEITLKSNLDQTQHQINKDIICNHSEFFRDVILPDSDSDVIDVDLTSEQLQDIIQFMNYHNQSNPFKSIPKPLPSKNLHQFVDQWDCDFILKKNEDQILNLIKAADQLNLKNLIDLCLAYIASSPLIGMSVQQLKQEYEINEDITPELEERIKKKYEQVFRDTEFSYFQQ